MCEDSRTASKILHWNLSRQFGVGAVGTGQRLDRFKIVRRDFFFFFQVAGAYHAARQGACVSPESKIIIPT